MQGTIFIGLKLFFVYFETFVLFTHFTLFVGGGWVGVGGEGRLRNSVFLSFLLYFVHPETIAHNIPLWEGVVGGG